MADRTHVHAYLAIAAALVAFHAVSNIAELPVPLGMIAGGLAWFAVDRFKPRPIPPGHCRKCGYNLTGNVSGRCPECGMDASETGPPTW